MTRTSGMDFGADSAHQWDTKHELFHLAEVCTRPSAILLCAVLLSCHSSDFFIYYLAKTKFLQDMLVTLYVFFLFVFFCLCVIIGFVPV